MMELIMKFLLVLAFITVMKSELTGSEMSNWQEFDEDDDIDPYEDDGEQINYPVKSVMPERAMPKDGPKVLPKEGSGAIPQKAILDFQLTGRLENLEKSLVFLTTKLNQQQMTNSELMAALTAQHEQRIKEKNAFVNAVGVLQGAVTQLASRVDMIPKIMQRDKRKHYKDYLTSTINNMSERIGKLGSRLEKKATEESSARDTRSRHATTSATRSTAGELLGKLLGKDLEKALEGITSKDTGKTEVKGVTSSGTQAVSAPIVPLNDQALTPIDLQPQSHLTSLSTPTGQGPAGSASSNPVQPNFSFMQVPSQTNVPAPSTPTGSGPVGSVSTMSPAELAPESPKTVSLTSFASKFKPPAHVAGYNVMPLVPVAPVPVPEQPLEPPGIISPQAVLPSLTGAAPPVPGSVNPYEVLTSAQMQQKLVPPIGFNGGVPQPAGSDTGNPYEFLTTSQAMPAGYPVAKGSVVDNGHLGKKEEIKMSQKGKKATYHKKNFKSKSTEIQEKDRKRVKKIGKGNKLSTNFLKQSGSKEKASLSLSKDPIIHDLVKAIKLGNLKKDELSNSEKKIHS